MTLIPKTAGEVVDQILYKVRSEGGIAFSKDWTRSVLGICQNVANTFLKRVFITTNWTLTPEKAIYDLDTEFKDLQETVMIKDEDRTLAKAGDWKELFGVDTCWFRTPARAPNMWCQVGHKFLAIYPQPKSARIVQITYLQDIQPLTDNGEVLSLPQEDLTFCVDMAELVVLMSTARGTKLDEVASKLQAFMQRYALTGPAIQDREEPKVGK